MGRSDANLGGNGDAPDTAAACRRVRVDGKFFEIGRQRWRVKGFTYGPFAPDAEGNHVPARARRCGDFAQIRSLGGNALRLYHPPPRELLDDALEHDLRVLIDVPWEKHRCFFEDHSSQQAALRTVRDTARAMGGHPGVFAISVANEIPHDIVRFYGARRIERFVGRLVDAVKQEAPDCPVTYANYPSTEFLAPAGIDFYCANVYLDDPAVLGRYLDRLQHVAGPLPLVLGEYGVDTIRNGDARQADLIGGHVAEVLGRGLAGSFVFAYTDDWFTGGYAITDWAFGVTRADRSPKSSAARLSELWTRGVALDREVSPKVSVVVCSYNGARTLDECLASLTALDYPDYEVILIDDGSTDHTREIAKRFPDVRYVRQANLGLSAARNAGAAVASGEVIAYTDSDCVADPDWLTYLMRAMRDQGVDAVGGPNLPPRGDGWVARCVAASPGGPGHVMLDDRAAEHVPGCNLAVRRDALMAIGGFDPQFRQAGDDVDFCWRLIDAGRRIGYGPAAVVWHHRRSTVRAYLSQQKGYGRAEAMLQLKHPGRFTATGRARWAGVIYGTAGAGPGPVYHGRFGAAPYQLMYPGAEGGAWSYCTLPEWHAVAVTAAALSFAWRPLLVVGALMWAATVFAGLRAMIAATLPANAPRWCRPLVFALHLLQPIVRTGHRIAYRLRHKRLPPGFAAAPLPRNAKRISALTHDVYFESDECLGREAFLEALVERAGRARWGGDFDAAWHVHDVRLSGDLWFDPTLRSATENLGGAKRFTRIRCSLTPTTTTWVVVAVTLLAIAVLLQSLSLKAAVPLAVVLLGCVVGVLLRSRGRCAAAVTAVVVEAGVAAGLSPSSLGEPVRAASAAPEQKDDAPARPAVVAGPVSDYVAPVQPVAPASA